MKKLFSVITILVCTLCLLSCGKNKPDNKAHETRSEFKGWQPNGVGNAPVEVFEEQVKLSPTWGQANYLARQRGDFAVWQVIAWVLLLASVAFFALYAKDYISPTALQFGATIFVLLALSLTCFKWQASSIKWNNDKFVSKAAYDKAMKEAGSTKPIWDVWEKNCQISGGPYKCYQK